MKLEDQIGKYSYAIGTHSKSEENVLEEWSSSVNIGSECSGGYMFAEPFSGGICVCGNGMWILKGGYCDNSAATYVIFADGNQCFSIKSNVKWIRYLGHPERAKIDAHYIASEHLDYFEKLRKNEPSRLVASKTIWTFAVGDSPANIYLPQEKICFRSDWRPVQDGAIPIARVGRSAEPPTDAFAEPHLAQQLSYCPYFAKEEQTEWIQGGGMVVKTGAKVEYFAQSNDAVRGDCIKKCSNVPPIVDKDYTTTASPLASAMDEPNKIEMYPLSEEFEDSLGKKMAGLEAANFTYNSSINACKMDNEAVKEMDLQTLRMMRSQTAYSLRQIKSSSAYIREYQYLQRARVILTDKCPALKPTLLKSFIRMFRFILLESIENHPYRQPGENESHSRILDSMYFCMNKTGGPDKNFTVIYKPNSCPQEVSHVGFQYGETPANVRNCSMRIPQELKFDSCKYDLVSEVTWKVILFSHYYCSRTMANFSQDQSEFYVTMERMFNPEVLMRYYNPGNSYKGLQFIFQMHDLDEFMSNLDKCIGCARDISQYRVWLKRPKHMKMCPMKSAEETVPKPTEFSFDTGGYTGIPRNPLYLPWQTEPKTKKQYQCYSSWKDGLYTRPMKQPVLPSCQMDRQNFR
ncbi:unnamed protein product [Allacma fusca]|uniref:Uncharacterized protein n=1 Tax=Allacma fusca TaxID=39272 RepID=A0A8J2KIK5_9HEXA|nr:unnamed protein product [Allacma fusca]